MTPSGDQLLNIDEQSVLSTIRKWEAEWQKFNKIVESGATATSKEYEEAFAKVQSAADRFGSKVVSITSQAERAQRRYVQSLEQAAAIAGRTGADKINAQYDSIIKKMREQGAGLRDLESNIARVNVVRQRMLELENKSPGGAGGGEQSQVRFLRALRDFYEGRSAYGYVQVGRGLSGLEGTAMVIGGVSAALLGLGLAGAAAMKSLAATGVEIQNVSLRTGFTTKQVTEFGFAAKAVGADVSIFERLMRGLTQATEDQSAAGDKAREWLMRFGVDIRAVRDGSVGTAALFEQIARGLSSMTNPLERNKAELDLFKRVGIEAIPVIEKLEDNLRIAREHGWGPDEAEQQKMLRYHQNITIVGEAWSDATRKVKEFFAAIAAGAIEGAAALVPTAPAGRLAPPGAPRRRQLEAAQPMPTPIGVAPAGPGLGPLGMTMELQRLQREGDEAAIRRYEQTLGPEYKLREAEKALGKLPAIEPGISTRDDIRRTQAAQAVVDSAKEEVRLANQRKSVEEAIAKLRTDVTERMAEATQKMFPAERELLTIEKSATGLRDAAALIKQARDILQPQLAREVREAVASATAIARVATEKAAEVAGPAGVVIPRTPEDLSARLREQRTAAETEFQKGLERQDRILNEGIRIANERAKIEQDIANTAAEGAAKVAATLGPGTIEARLAAEREMAQVRLRGIDEAFEHDMRQAQAKFLYDSNAENEMSMLRLKHADDVQKVELQYQEELAREERRQLDTIKHDAEGLLTTLFTQPGKFGAQLGTTLRTAALKPVTEGLSEQAAQALHPLIYGATGTGGIAGTLRGAFGGGTASRPLDRLYHEPLPVVIVGGGGTAPLTAPGSYLGGLFEQRMSTVPGISTPTGPLGLDIPGYRTADAAVNILRSRGALRYLQAPDEALPGTGEGLPSYAGGAGPPGITTTTFNGIPTGPGTVFGDTAFSDAAAAVGGPGATSGFAGPVSSLAGLVGPGGFGGGGGAAAGRGGFGGFGGLLSGFRGLSLGGLTHGDLGGRTIFGRQSITGVSGLAGLGLLMGGTALMQQAFLGSSQGTAAGIGLGTLGGAMTGFKFGGPLGAAIGAVAGFGVGLGEMLAGVEPKWKEAERLVKQVYGLTVPHSVGQSIADIAKQRYGDRVSIAVRSPEVRQMLGLYAAGTGQPIPQSAMQAHGGALVEAGGRLQQQATYQYGNPFVYQSMLPVYGGGATGTPGILPGPGQFGTGGNVALSFHIDGGNIERFMDGRVFSPSKVGDKMAGSFASSAARQQNSLTLAEPGSIVS